MNRNRKLVLSGLFIALGIIIPYIFHAFGSSAGKIFLPMHIPVLLAGFIVGPVFGMLVGMITPILSSLLTGMPPFIPMAVIMLFELGAYGFISGYLYQELNKNEIISLVGAVVGGRIVAGVILAIVVYIFGITKFPKPVAFVWGSVTTGIVGIIIQLVFIPSIMLLLERNGFIKEDRSAKRQTVL